MGEITDSDAQLSVEDVVSTLINGSLSPHWVEISSSCRAAFSTPSGSNEVTARVLHRILCAFSDIDVSVTTVSQAPGSREGWLEGVGASLHSVAREALALEKSAATLPADVAQAMAPARHLLRNFVQGSVAAVLEAIPGQSHFSSYPQETSPAAATEHEVWLKEISNLREHALGWNAKFGDSVTLLTRLAGSTADGLDAASPALRVFRTSMDAHAQSVGERIQLLDLWSGVVSGQWPATDMLDTPPEKQLHGAAIDLAYADLARVDGFGKSVGPVLRRAGGKDRAALVASLGELQTHAEQILTSIASVDEKSPHNDTTSQTSDVTLVDVRKLHEAINRDLIRLMKSRFARRRPTMEAPPLRAPDSAATESDSASDGEQLSQQTATRVSAILRACMAEIGDQAGHVVSQIDALWSSMALERLPLLDELMSLKQHLVVMRGAPLSGLDVPDGVIVVGSNLARYAQGIVSRVDAIADEFDAALRPGSMAADRKKLRSHVDRAISDAEALRAIFTKCGKMVLAINSCVAETEKIAGFPAPSPIAWPHAIADRPLTSVRRLRMPAVSPSADRARIALNKRNVHETKEDTWVRFTLLVYSGNSEEYRLLVGERHDPAVTSGHRVTGSIWVLSRSPGWDERLTAGARQLFSLHPRKARRELDVAGDLYVQMDDAANDKYEAPMRAQLKQFTHKSAHFPK